MVAVFRLVHKQILNLGFEGLKVTFEALMNLFVPHIQLKFRLKITP